MSPPSTFLCHAYNSGGCHLSQDECLNAHLLARPDSRFLQIRHAHLSPQDAPIAEAAHRAGFDCSNWSRVKNLINAVRGATTLGIYPDRYRPMYNGKGSLQASEHITSNATPSDHTTSNHTTSSYTTCDEERPQDSTTNTATGSNRQPLALRSSNKRTFPEAIDTPSPSSKRLKTQEPTQSTATGTSTEPIDLTQEKPSAPILPPVRLSQSMITRATLSKRGKKAANKKIRELQHLGAEASIQRGTAAIFATIASKLRASASAIDADRHALRDRWDIDRRLRDQLVTDHLADLNEYFCRAEDGIMDALDVVERWLL